MQELFDNVRESASRPVWSRGVELARQGAVEGEHAEAAEVVVRVRTRGVVHPSVILYVDDAEWECDCGGPDDPCEHVAAAAIAVRKARQQGEALPTGRRSGRVAYRFNTGPEGISLERTIRTEDEEVPLRTTLAALASGRVSGPEVTATQADLAIEHALGPRLAGALPHGVLRALLKPLAEVTDLTLDGEPVSAEPEPAGLRAILEDDPEGFRLRVRRDPPIDRDLGSGLVRCADTLRPVAGTQLLGRELESLRGRGRLIRADEVAELLGEVLPDLETRVPVDVVATRLPTARREKPRLVVDLDEAGGQMRALATLVYGDPPVARVDAGRLTHLEGPVPIRDEEEERRLTERLRTAFGLVPGRRVELTTPDALDLVERLDRFDAQVVGDARRRYRREASLVPDLRIDGRRMQLDFRSGAGETAGAGDGAGARAEAGAVLAAWRRGESFVQLDGGGFAPLPADWLARHGQRVADLLAARGERDSEELPAALLPDLARLCDDLDEPRPDLGALERLVATGHAATAAPLPEDLRAELRPYQRVGVDWLASLGEAELGALLADDMGLGKTVQALAALRPPALVVAPTSVLPNWAHEIKQFRPSVRVSLHHGARRALDPDAEITLTSYALLRRDRDDLAAVDWETLVLDEAQAIKNPQSQVAEAAHALRAARRIALTGTPIENRLTELWSQMHLLNRGLLGSRADFEARYAGPIASGDEAMAAHLRERIRPFVLRRRKSEVAPELPPRTESVLRVALRDDERAVYDAVRAATLEDVVARLESGGGVMAALEALLRLRQACCDASLVPGQSAGDEPSSKLALLRDRLETASADGHKALVFSQWTGLLDRVEPLLEEADLPFVRLDGSTRDRQSVVDSFQSPDGPPVFLISLRAGGTGLNLTAADHVFLLDPWWNPAVEDQAADRAHRIGQDRPVFVHRMVARDSVEERILALQARKRALAESALGDAATAPTLSRADILELLQGDA